MGPCLGLAHASSLCAFRASARRVVFSWYLLLADEARSAISCSALESLCRSRSLFLAMSVKSFLAMSVKMFVTKPKHFKIFGKIVVLFSYCPFLSFLPPGLVLVHFRNEYNNIVYVHELYILFRTERI